MGMFDNIKYKMSCPECGARVDGFQSKDGECTLATLRFWEVDSFYTSCNECDAWIEFSLKKAKRKRFQIEDYDMHIETKAERPVDNYNDRQATEESLKKKKKRKK